MKKNQAEMNIADNPLYHDTWKLLKKYRDVVWSLELSVQQVRSRFEIRAAGGGAFLGRVGHRQISFPFSSFLSCSIFSLALAFLKFSPVMRTGVHISVRRS